MPLIHYLCECKKTATKFFRQPKDAAAFLLCPACGKETLKKQLSAPSNSVKINIDNGLMSRSVEVREDILQLNEERSNKDYSKED